MVITDIIIEFLMDFLFGDLSSYFLPPKVESTVVHIIKSAQEMPESRLEHIRHELLTSKKEAFEIEIKPYIYTFQNHRI